MARKKHCLTVYIRSTRHGGEDVKQLIICTSGVLSINSVLTLNFDCTIEKKKA